MENLLEDSIDIREEPLPASTHPGGYLGGLSDEKEKGCWQCFNEAVASVFTSSYFHFFSSVLESAVTLAFIFISLWNHSSLLLFKLTLGTSLTCHVIYSLAMVDHVTELSRNRHLSNPLCCGLVNPYSDGVKTCLIKLILMVPFLNHIVEPFVLSSLPKHDRRLVHVSVAWCCLQSFTLYIFCLSYALDGGDLDWPWISALSVAGISLVCGPFHAISRDIAEHEEKGTYISCFFWTGLWFAPIIMIEIIHFFPLLFAYLYYHSIDTSLFIKYLLAFNIPKTLFLLLRIYNSDSLTEEERRVAMNTPDGILEKASSSFLPVLIGRVAAGIRSRDLQKILCTREGCQGIVAAIVGSCIVIAVPLVPAALILWAQLQAPQFESFPYHKNKAEQALIERKNIQTRLNELHLKCFSYRWDLGVLALYMCIAYGSLLHLVLFTEDPGWIVQVSVYTTMALVVIIVVQHLTLKMNLARANWSIYWMWNFGEAGSHCSMISMYGEARTSNGTRWYLGMELPDVAKDKDQKDPKRTYPMPHAAV